MTDEAPLPLTFAFDLRLATDDEVEDFYRELAAQGRTPDEIVEHRRRFADSPEWIATFMDCRIGHAGDPANLEWDDHVVWYRTDEDVDRAANEQAHIGLDHYLKSLRMNDGIDVWPEDMAPRDMAIRVDPRLRAEFARRMP